MKSFYAASLVLLKTRCRNHRLNLRVPRVNLRVPRNSKGQAVLEYVLLMAVIFIASTIMISFIRNGLFGAGLAELPQKVSACLSHRVPGAGGVQCQ